MIWGLFNKKPNEQQAESKGLFDGLRKSSTKLAESFSAVFSKEKLDAAGLAELEEALIRSDMGAPAAARITTALADQRFRMDDDGREARQALAAEVARILKPREAHLDLHNGPKPRIVLVIGVNGSGKTTTIGKLAQNHTELMAELAKIVRVMRKIDDDAPHETLLVLDATVGQNALSQLENFRSVTDITGIVMTKLDGTAKGGVLVAVAQRHAIPIHFIGVGERAEDLRPFDADAFSRALVGLD